jgi:hypothetical protein
MCCYCADNKIGMKNIILPGDINPVIIVRHPDEHDPAAFRTRVAGQGTE